MGPLNTPCVAPGHAEQLDAVSELVGEFQVGRGDVADTLHGQGVERDGLEGQAGKDGQLVGRVPAIHVR